MSKRRKKGRKNGQHDAHVRRYRIQMCRNYSAYEKKRRRGKGNKIVTRIKKLKEMIPAVLKGASKDETSALLCVLDMVFRNHSYRVHVTYMELHPGTVNAYGLKDSIKIVTAQHGKSAVSRTEQLAGLLLAQAGDDACGTVIGDSSGFSIMNYVDWEEAKKGLVSRREFDKLHVSSSQM